MFNFTRDAWRELIMFIRKNEGEGVYFDTLVYLLFIIFLTIPVDIIISPLEIIICIVIKTDKNKKKRK